MGLKGKISEFAIADIFQLLSVQHKSGALEIKSPKGEMVFIFKGGQLVDVTPDVRSKGHLIGQMLVDGGVISETERDRVLKVHHRKGPRFGEILVDRGIVDSDTLSRYLTIQIKECFFQALTYKEGQYKFDAYTVTGTAPIKEPVRVDQLLLEGMQFLDEFPIIMEKFPGKGLLVKAKEGFGREELAKETNAVALYDTMGEYMVPMKHLRRAGLTELEGYKAFAYLLEIGALLTKEVEEESARERKETARKKNIREMQRENAATLVFLSLFVGTVVYLICDTINRSGIFLMLKEILKGF